MNIIQFFISNPGASAIIVAVIVWWLNEHSKRHYEEYIRKETRYSSLLEAVKGFYMGTQRPELKQKFIDEIDQCWLYCPDSVIEKGYEFLMKVHSDKVFSDTEKEDALREFILEIRKDLYGANKFWQVGPLKKTNLKKEDYKILKVNE